MRATVARGSALQSAGGGAPACSSPSLPPEGDTINTSKKTLLELLLFRGCPCLAPCSSDGSALLGKNKTAHKYFLERKELQQLTSGSVHVHGHTPANGELHIHAAKQLCTHIHTHAQRHTSAQLHVTAHRHMCMDTHMHTCPNMDIQMRL